MCVVVWLAQGNALVKATIQIYNTIREQLLPTPAKSHYTYNMRDISKVFQGIQRLGVPLSDPKQLVRLWAHETLRVFHDRLINDDDRLWFCDYLKQMVDTTMGLKFDKVFEDYGDGSGTVPITNLRKVRIGLDRLHRRRLEMTKTTLASALYELQHPCHLQHNRLQHSACISDCQHRN
jgi:hypothetical protein